MLEIFRSCNKLKFQNMLFTVTINTQNKEMSDAWLLFLWIHKIKKDFKIVYLFHINFCNLQSITEIRIFTDDFTQKKQI